MLSKQNFYIGAAFLCLGLIIVPINDALAKILSSDLNIMEVIWSRFFGHFIFLVPIALYIHGKEKFINKLETDTKNGVEKLVFHETQKGQHAKTIIPKIIKSSLPKLPTPKRMRWGSSREEFVRPIHWILLLFGRETLSPVSYTHLTLPTIYSV